MITTNQQKKTLVDRLYRDNHITLDEVIELLKEPEQYPFTYQPMDINPALKYPLLTVPSITTSTGPDTLTTITTS